MRAPSLLFASYLVPEDDPGVPVDVEPPEPPDPPEVPEPVEPLLPPICSAACWAVEVACWVTFDAVC